MGKEIKLTRELGCDERLFGLEKVPRMRLGMVVWDCCNLPAGWV